MPATEVLGVDVGIYIPVGAGTPVQTLVGGLRNAQFTVNGSVIDISHGGNYGWRKKLPGLLDWGLTGNVMTLIDAATGAWDAALGALRTAQRARKVISVEIRFPGTTPPKEVGDAIVTQLQITRNWDGALEGSFNLEGAGPLVPTGTF